MSRERDLLEQALKALRAEYGSDPLKLEKEIMSWLLEPEQNEEPVAWMLISTVGSRHYHMSEQQALKGLQMYGGKVIALYDHPAPRKPFVRLSEETIRWEYEKTEKSLRTVTLTEYGWFCAGAQWADEANRTEYDAM